MKARTRRAMLSAADLAGVLAPRRGVVEEVQAGAAPAGATPAGADPGQPVFVHAAFVQAEGPLAGYRRTVTVRPASPGSRATPASPPGPASHPGPGLLSVEQSVSLSVGLPFVSWLFAWPLARHLTRVGPDPGFPWWAPPARLPRQAAVNLATLCALSVLAGYLAGLLPDTMTYAAAERGVGTTGQGIALGIAQLGAVLALGLLVVADRVGRRRVILLASAAACVVSAGGSLSPDLTALVATQMVGSALATAAAVALGVVAVEELPSGTRAWGIAVIAMSGGLGSGLTLAALPLAGAGPGGWRWLYVLALLGVPWAARCGRSLTETERFLTSRARRRPAATATATAATGSRHAGARRPYYRRRLLILGAGAVLLALFASPAGQFQNQYLRAERHLSALEISLLAQLAGTIGGLGTIAGGRLADTWGRRPVAVLAVIAGAGATLGMYFTAGPVLWVWASVASWFAYAATPALAVYGGELFPTEIRGRAGGILTILASAGGLIGLVVTGRLASLFGSIGPALAILAASQIGLAVLVLFAYPETAGIVLEDLLLHAPGKHTQGEPDSGSITRRCVCPRRRCGAGTPGAWESGRDRSAPGG